MKRLFLFMLISGMIIGPGRAFDKSEIEEYKLPNGLTVLLWPDKDKTDVTGYVAVRAGAVDDPEEYTGLAHYLEHMLFKGTERIGAIDWEKEKPHYEKIIALYDKFSETKDAKEREKLTTEINEESRKAAEYSTTEDFFKLMDGIGATGVNAYTSYDMTCYHNSFPPNNMYKWLTIFSDRLINPVFRTFQAELENVYEEFNMYSNSVQSKQYIDIAATLYPGHPYGREVIGLQEHIKNPRISKLIEFYNTWYVANNMALMMVGNFDKDKVKPMIESTFGRLEPKELPTRKSYPEAKFQPGRHSFKLGYYPELIWAYEGIPINHEDATKLEFVCSLLNNSMNTGLLDKIMLDGDISYAAVELDSRREMGRIMLVAIPYFDANQQSYESNAMTEKTVMREINKMKLGNIPDWLIKSVKKSYSQDWKLMSESSSTKMDILLHHFIYDVPFDDVFNSNKVVQAMTREDIEAIVKKYFDTNTCFIEFNEGELKKNEIAKPKIKPLDNMKKGAETEYDKMFAKLPSDSFKQTYFDFKKVQSTAIDEHVNLHYSKNSKNDIFSLTLRYGVGSMEKPLLESVASLMNMSGIMPNSSPQDFRRQLSELGGRVSYSASENYFYVNLLGDESRLKDICQLVQRQMLFPKFEQKQFEAVRGGELSNRMLMSAVDAVQPNALLEYVLYDKKSHFIDVLPFKDIYYLDESKLKSEFLEATKYDLDIYYCGKKKMEEVQATLTESLPLQEGMIKSKSPQYRDKQTYDKTQIIFVPNTNLQQATIYFYFNGVPFDKRQSALYDAFNQYFDGGFSGIVLDEIRTQRSMAYTAFGEILPGELPDRKSYFLGYIGTQSDKVVTAVNTFMNLVDSMPLHPERINTVKQMLLQQYQISKPGMRTRAQIVDNWKTQWGFKEDPAKAKVQDLQNIQFDNIVNFYKEYIQGKPVTIMIVGDPKKIDQKALTAKYGKIKKLSKTNLFAPLDLDFIIADR